MVLAVKERCEATHSKSWVTSVRTADEVAAELGELDEANRIRCDAGVPLLEGVGEWICDSNSREGRERL